MIAAAAVSPPSPPPPPPTPPPLLPLERGEPACQDLSLSKGHRALYSVFGGSNTQGANAVALSPKGGTMYGRGNPSFAHLLAKRMMATHDAKWNADGGSGPILAGTCASMFMPADTRLGTIEYLPNLGYIHEDKAEVGAVKAMLHMLRARGAAAFLVNIVSGTKRYENDARGGRKGRQCRKLGYRENVIGCMSRERLLSFRDKLARAANETGAYVITIDADEVPHLFGADSFHLNANGHRKVFNEIWRLYPMLTRASQSTRTDVRAPTSLLRPVRTGGAEQLAPGPHARAVRAPASGTYCGTTGSTVILSCVPSTAISHAPSRVEAKARHGPIWSVRARPSGALGRSSG